MSSSVKGGPKAEYFLSTVGSVNNYIERALVLQAAAYGRQHVNATRSDSHAPSEW